jgi:ABC-type arginine transport system permease subunit
MLQYAPIIGRPIIYTHPQKRKTKKMTLAEITTVPSPYPTLVIPFGSDSSLNHAICVVDNLIFDSTQSHALKCGMEAISWVCASGSKGVCDVYEALRFQYPEQCSPLKCNSRTNW